MNKLVKFITNATVQAEDGTYLERRADGELFQLCRQGQYAYVLTSRQMGKSSLMLATAKKLHSEKIKTAIVDLQGIGQDTANIDQWYIGVLVVLTDQLELNLEVE
ncbi:MAG: hypothetical protein F6K09_19370, partial [Merismopedia sp. SIO2A8]|nr:hypothetical protein [Merismopedia sp. SIO2A8]